MPSFESSHRIRRVRKCDRRKFAEFAQNSQGVCEPKKGGKGRLSPLYIYIYILYIINIINLRTFPLLSHTLCKAHYIAL